MIKLDNERDSICISTEVITWLSGGGGDAVRFHEVLSPGFTTPVYLVYRRENELLRPILKCLRAYFAAPQPKR